MTGIRILPEKVASQIAAGEVIERPASVVRELMDNSLDAGAQRIVLDIERGGRSLIKVSDDGEGMSRDDLLLCVERHATSKIETASDLFSVKSFGFRGEALPSIASVSRLSITSRPRDQIAGHRLKMAGGKLSSIEETGSPPGTAVEVRDLFFNTPARRKFMRAARTETDHIVDAVSRAALPFPDVAFMLNDSGRNLLNLPASDRQLQRLAALLGRKVAQALVEAEEDLSILRISAFLAPWEYSRSRGDRLFVYVNGRYIRDRMVTRAVIEGYGQRLMKGQYPQAVVFLDTDPDQVDVNVHPTKQEVRFHRGRDVYRAIVAAVEKALGPPPALSGEGPARVFQPWAVQGPQEGSFVFESAKGYRDEGEIPAGVDREEPEIRPEAEGGPNIIGQLGGTYILCEVKDGLLMVDQHAAHERIMYESMRRGLGSSRIEAQTLLMPHRLELSSRETRTVLEKGEHLARVGIELDHFGGETFLLRSVPALLKEVDWDALVSELAALLDEREPVEVLLDRVLKVMACHGAIRSGYRMTREEMVHLFRQLEEVDLPTNCPHGRPIFRHISYYEMEKMFKRVV
jgi:DNA mismatch repair protein MutL